jgi:2-phosphosulfolactate phosphatase
MPNVEVCLSPDLLHLFNLRKKNVVVVDILRATSCMVTALAHDVEVIIPVASIEECKFLQKQGYISAAERDGLKVEGFELDNSPFSYQNEDLKGKKIAVTTTNGTQAITKSVEAEKIIIGAFLNISAVAAFLLEEQRDVIILCAGWKGNFNLEDTLFAGALIEILQKQFTVEQDSSLAALELYLSKKTELLPFILASSHAKRLSKLNIKDDIAFCLQHDTYDVLPIFHEKELRNYKINV